MTEEQIQPQSAVDSKPKFQKHVTKGAQGSQCAFIRENSNYLKDIISYFSTPAVRLAQVK